MPQTLRDKKLKGQLAVREKLYSQSAKAAAKAEKVQLRYLFLSLDYNLMPIIL